MLIVGPFRQGPELMAEARAYRYLGHLPRDSAHVSLRRSQAPTPRHPGRRSQAPTPRHPRRGGAGTHAAAPTPRHPRRGAPAPRRAIDGEAGRMNVDFAYPEAGASPRRCVRNRRGDRAASAPKGEGKLDSPRFARSAKPMMNENGMCTSRAEAAPDPGGFGRVRRFCYNCLRGAWPCLSLAWM